MTRKEVFFRWTQLQERENENWTEKHLSNALKANEWKNPYDCDADAVQ